MSRAQELLNPSVWRSLENLGAELARRRTSAQWGPASPPSAPGDRPLLLLALPGVLPQRECCLFQYQREPGSHGRRAESGRWAHREVLPACGNWRESLDGRNLSRDPAHSPRTWRPDQHPLRDNQSKERKDENDAWQPLWGRQ